MSYYNQPPPPGGAYPQPSYNTGYGQPQPPPQHAGAYGQDEFGPGQYHGGGIGAPQLGWGDPIQQPPQQPYGQAQPPQGQYGQPLQVMGQYGAGGAVGYAQQPPPPPPIGSGYAPPPPQHQQYAAAPPPPQNLYLHVPIPPAAGSHQPPLTSIPGFDPLPTINRIRTATKGFGTNENDLISALTTLSAFEVDAVRRGYEGVVGRGLVKTIEKETSGWLEVGLVLCALGPVEGDVYLLHRACSGPGTTETTLTEILLRRSNFEMHTLKAAYRTIHGRELSDVIRGELSYQTERLFLMALAGTRDENPVVDRFKVDQDVDALYRAGAAKMGTDEIAFCGIMVNRSDEHMASVASVYKGKYRHDLSQVIRGEFSGHMQDALLFLALAAEQDGHAIQRDAELLESSMAGIGTKDEQLTMRIVREHWCKPRWAQVKEAYRGRYRKTLEQAVKGETTGKFENLLVAMSR